MSLRTLTPLGWAAAALAVVAVVVAAGAGLGLRWDPLNLAGRRLEAARAEASHARADADARRIEAAVETDQRRRVAAVHHQAVAISELTAAAVTRSRMTDAAEDPLDADSALGLRAHDDGLCRLAPELGGCAAAPGPAG